LILLENISWLVRDSSRIEQNTSLLIDGNHIAAIGKPEPEIPGLFRVNCRGKAVIPGLINAHTHLWQLLLRGCRDDYPLDRWCNEITLPLIQTLKGSVPPKTDIPSQFSYLWMQAGICEMLRCGTTGFIDMDLEYVPEGLGRACKDMGMRGSLALEMSDTWYKKDAKACKRTRETVVRFAEEFNDPDGTLKVILGPSEPSMCSPE